MLKYLEHPQNIPWQYLISFFQQYPLIIHVFIVMYMHLEQSVNDRDGSCSCLNTGKSRKLWGSRQDVFTLSIFSQNHDLGPKSAWA